MSSNFATHIRMWDHKEWDTAGLDKVMERHEMEYVNQEEDGCDQSRGEWYITDDETRTIIYGTFGNDNSPGASSYTYADIYEDTDEGREEYEETKAEWEAKEEYLESEEDEEEEMVECIECGDEFSEEDMNKTGAGDDYICDDCLHDRNNPTPEDDDLVTDDGITFYVVGTGSLGNKGTIAFRVEPNRSVRQVYNDYVEEEGGNFFPSVYMAEERGGYHVFDMEDNDAHLTDDCEEEDDCTHERIMAYTEDGTRYHACRDCGEIWEQNDDNEGGTDDCEEESDIEATNDKE